MLHSMLGVNGRHQYMLSKSDSKVHGTKSIYVSVRVNASRHNGIGTTVIGAIAGNGDLDAAIGSDRKSVV